MKKLIIALFVLGLTSCVKPQSEVYFIVRKVKVKKNQQIVKYRLDAYSTRTVCSNTEYFFTSYPPKYNVNDTLYLKR